MSTQSSLGLAPSSEPRTWTWLALWASLVASAFVLVATAVAINGYDSWVSAHYGVMARSFIEHGVVALKGLPIQNNPPLTLLPDYYPSWPPLYPIALSFAFRLFGQSEIVQNLFSVFVTLGTAAIVFFAVRRVSGPACGVFGAIVFLNFPLVARLGYQGLHVHMAVFFCSASLYCALRALERDGGAGRRSGRAFAGVGAVLMVLAVWSSWEPILSVVGLAAVALVRRDYRALRLAIAYGLAGAAAIGLVAYVYYLQYPEMLQVMIGRILSRTGTFAAGMAGEAAALNPHLIQEINQRLAGTLPHFYPAKVILRLVLFGPLGLLALVCLPILLLRGRSDALRRTAFLLSGGFAVVIIWGAVMTRHMEAHDYQLLFVAPAIAVAVAVLVGEALPALSRLPFAREGQVGAVSILLAIALAAIFARGDETARRIWKFRTEPHPDITFARQVGAIVPANSIVAHTSPDMVPVYYMNRHVVRDVSDETRLARYRKMIEDLCADCPVYMAIPRDDEPSFAGLLAADRGRDVGGLGRLVLLRSGK